MAAILIAGTTSDAGKSMVVTGLCRAFARQGVKVAPFKAQNMSNNSAVCPGGGEIGRAQALQACAAGLEPEVKYNPILLKPGSDRTSQLVLNGVAQGQVSATSYFGYRQHLLEAATAALAELEAEFDLVLCEGAGSPAEINLRHSDIANLGLATAADLKLLVVGDIDKGGVLAALYGTYHILAAADRARIKGFIINKFRGDPSILAPGLTQLEEKTGVATLGVLPFLPGLWVDAEDSLSTTIGSRVGPGYPARGSETLTVAAIRLPRISNATDVEALAVEPGIDVVWTQSPAAVASADLVVLPGSKATISDLGWLREQGIAAVLQERARKKRPILGICGGYQMLCREINDPVEAGSPAPVAGLGVFDTVIEFHPEKTLATYDDGSYEIHHGRVISSNSPCWLTDVTPAGEGNRLPGVWGTHRHGLLEADEQRRAFLEEVLEFLPPAKQAGFKLAGDTNFKAERNRQIDLIADCVAANLDLDLIWQLAQRQ